MTNPIGYFAFGGTGEIAGSVAAVQAPSRKAKMVAFKAQALNAGNVYIGDSAAVTVPGGTTDVTSGWPLAAGEETAWLPCANLDDFFIICDNATDHVSYMILT